VNTLCLKVGLCRQEFRNFFTVTSIAAVEDGNDWSGVEFEFFFFSNLIVGIMIGVKVLKFILIMLDVQLIFRD
jgi:hypothetical protein